ncbi:MAG: hypothetical protein KIT83_00730 [Bryobacterales bacterium]|nr:hypothetical protein [Bryobacterales bacterium]
MNDAPIRVVIFCAPDAGCGSGATWSGAASFVRERLLRRFGDRAETEHVEVFTPRFFEFPNALSALAAGSPLPFVMVGGQIISQGGKLSDRVIGEAVAAQLASRAND